MNVTGETALVLIIGDPVAHSLSPQLHNAWIADHALDAVYAALPVVGDARAFFAGLRHARLRGANVTVPHKEAAAAEFSAGALRAANTLVWRDGQVSAHNTDGAGFLASLDEGAVNWRSDARNALVLGAGGAASGLVDALAGAGLAVAIANRTRARAEALANGARNATVADWDALPGAFAAADLIVNATTLGMHGQPSPAWPLERCTPATIVADIVYRPLETPLLAGARARGLRAVDGLGMLIHQGAKAFELWFGVAPDTEAARMRLEAILEEGFKA